MFLRAACLFVAFILVSSQNAAEDVTEDIELKALKPGSGSYTGETLSVKCSFDRSQTDLDSVTKLELFATNVDEENYELVASYFGDAVSYGMSESDISVEGKTPAEATKKSKLQVTFVSADTGYCKFYKCVVTGLKSGTEATYKAFKEVKAKAGDSGCKAQKNEEMIGGLTTQLEQCKAALAPWKTAFNKLQGINGTLYAMSSINNGRVYVARRIGIISNIQARNEECKTFGGYLVEFDDEVEQQFVGELVQSLRRGRYFTGGNDIDSEGDYVYYNSKKPMTNVKWRPDEPNHETEEEDCVVVNYVGLNDVTCSFQGRHICEIPLM